MKEEILRELIKGLCDIFVDSLDSIILYGSYARNEEREDSDVDIAVVLKCAMNDSVKNEFLKFMSRMDLKYDKVFSGVDIERDMLLKWGKILPFYKNVLNEGIVLWKAA